MGSTDADKKKTWCCLDSEHWSPVSLFSPFQSSVLAHVFFTRACVCSILTLYFRAHYADPEDSTWVQVEVITVGYVSLSRGQTVIVTLLKRTRVFEPLVAIITSCLPSMPALWVSVSAHGFTSFRHLISHFSTTNLTRSNRSEQGSYELYDRFDGQRSASARSLNIKGGGFDLEHGVTTHNASTPQSNHQIAHGS